MVQDKDINSPEVATLAAQAADLLTMAHAAAVEDAANSQGGDITSGEPHTPQQNMRFLDSYTSFVQTNLSSC